MATTAANAATDKPKSKRTPIVLNMHLLYADNEKKPNKDVKDSKDLKVEKDADKNTLKVGESKMAESSKDVANAKGIAKKENGMEKDEKEAAAGGRGQSEKVCRDFMRSMCNRGDKCKFYHPPQENPGAGGKRRSSWLVLCHDFQNGQCTRSDCRYFHITREDERVYHTSGEIHPLVVDQVMRKAYHLDIFRSGTRQPCREFLRGTCDLSTCKYRHLNRREYEDEVFRALQDEFELTFGSPDRRGGMDGPARAPYPQRNIQDSSWGYDRMPGDTFDHPLEPGFNRPAPNLPDNIPPDDLRATLRARNEFEPDPKRRRHFSNEGYYGNQGGFEGDRRTWPEGGDFNQHYVGVDPAETEKIMREINSLRNENMDLRRDFEQQILSLKEQTNVLTDESASLRHENSELRSSLNDADSVKKAAVDKLMTANDTLTSDNKQLKSNIFKLEHENLELKKKVDKKYEDLEKEKEEVKRSHARARELEQKAREELQKLRNEKEALAKSAAKSDKETPKTNIKVDATSVKNDAQKQDQIQNKNAASGRMSSTLTGFGPSGDSKKQSDTSAPVTQGPGMNTQWNNQQQNKTEPSKPKSLLGEYIKPASLLGEYGPAAGRVLIGKRNPDITPKEMPSTPAQPQPAVNITGSGLIANQLKEPAALRGPSFTANQSQRDGNLRGPNFSNNQPQSSSLLGPKFSNSPSEPPSNLRGPSFKDNQPPPAGSLHGPSFTVNKPQPDGNFRGSSLDNRGPSFRDNQSLSSNSLRGPSFNDNQPQGGGNFRGSNFNDNQSQRAENYRGSNFNDGKSLGPGNYRGSNYGDSQSQGGNYRGSNLGDNQSQGQGNYRGSNYNDSPSQGGNYRGPNFGGNQSQGQGNFRGSDYSDAPSQGQGTYRGSNFDTSHSQGQGNYRGSNFNDGQPQGVGPYRGSNFSDSQIQGTGNFRGSSVSDNQSQGSGNYHGSNFSDSQLQGGDKYRGYGDSPQQPLSGFLGSNDRYRLEDRDYGLRDSREFGLRSNRDYGLAGYDKDMGDLRSSYARGNESRPGAQPSQWGSNLRGGFNY